MEPATSTTSARVLAIVQAGGQGSRMDVLTRERAKPVLPFAGTHALVDFALSALAASGISDVWVRVQFQASSMDEHLCGGRPWDLDRTYGGFRRLVPEQGAGSPHESGFSHGNADDLFRIRDQIRSHRPDVLVVMSADHVFSTDLRPVIAQHLARKAECTVVTAGTGVVEAAEQMVVDADAEGRVRRVDYKPGRTDLTTVATEIFVYDPGVLLDRLEHLWRLRHAGAEDPDDTGLGDFGEHLVPDLVARGRTWTHPVTGYWKDLGRPQAYLQAHRDLLAGRVDVFDHADRPVLGHPVLGPPGLVLPGADLEGTMIGPACRVEGRVARSVLGPGVVVRAGAVVEDSVLLGRTEVESGAIVRTAVVDHRVTIGRDAVVGAPAAARLSDDAIVLVGADVGVPPGAVVPAGARLEPGTTSAVD